MKDGRPASRYRNFQIELPSMNTPGSRTVIVAAVLTLIAIGLASCSASFPEPTPRTTIHSIGPLHGFVEAENGSVAGYPSLGAEPTGLSGYKNDVLVGAPDQLTDPDTDHSYSLDQGAYIGLFSVVATGPAFLTVVSETDGHGLMGAGDEIKGRAVFIVNSPVGSRLRIEGEVGQPLGSLRMEIDREGDGIFDDSVEPDIVRTGDDLNGYWDSHVSAEVEELGSGQAQVSLVPDYGEAGIDQTYFWVFPSSPSPHLYSEPIVLNEPSYVLFTYFNPEGKQEEMGEVWILGGAPSIDQEIELDEEMTISFAEPGEVAHLRFSGTEGQRLVPQILTSDLSPFPCCSAYMLVLTPNGRPLTRPFGIATEPAAMPTVVLPEDGNYTVVVDPYLAYTGEVTVVLEQLSDVSAQLALDDPPQAIHFDHTEQLGFVTFEGESGQQVSIVVERPESSRCCSADVMVVSPRGALLTSGKVHSTYEDVLTLRTQLTEDGTYTVVIEPRWVPHPGNLSVAAFAVVDLRYDLVPDSPPRSLDLSVPGQTAELSFEGIAGQRWFISVTDRVAAGSRNRLIDGEGRTKLTVLDASTRNELVRAWLSKGGVSVASVILPTSGEIVVELDPPDKTTGSLEVVVLSSAPQEPRLTAAAMPGENPSSEAIIDSPELRVQRSFFALEGQLLELRIDDVNVEGSSDAGAFWPHLYGPDGEDLSYEMQLHPFGATGLLVDLQIPATGTYVIDIESYKSAATGSFEILLLPGGLEDSR